MISVPLDQVKAWDQSIVNRNLSSLVPLVLQVPPLEKLPPEASSLLALLALIAVHPEKRRAKDWLDRYPPEKALDTLVTFPCQEKARLICPAFLYYVARGWDPTSYLNSNESARYWLLRASEWGTYSTWLGVDLGISSQRPSFLSTLPKPPRTLMDEKMAQILVPEPKTVADPLSTWKVIEGVDSQAVHLIKLARFHSLRNEQMSALQALKEIKDPAWKSYGNALMFPPSPRDSREKARAAKLEEYLRKGRI